MYMSEARSSDARDSNSNNGALGSSASRSRSTTNNSDNNDSRNPPTSLSPSPRMSITRNSNLLDASVRAVVMSPSPTMIRRLTPSPPVSDVTMLDDQFRHTNSRPSPSAVPPVVAVSSLALYHQKQQQDVSIRRSHRSPSFDAIDTPLCELMPNGDAWRQVHMVFRSVDSDHDGLITYNEALTCLDLLGIQATHTELNSFLRQCGMVNGHQHVSFPVFLSAIINASFRCDKSECDLSRPSTGPGFNNNSARRGVIHPASNSSASCIEKVAVSYVEKLAIAKRADAERFRRAEYHHRTARRMTIADSEPIHGDNPTSHNANVNLESTTHEDRLALRATRRSAILWAVFAGLVSAVVCGLCELMAKEFWGPDDKTVSEQYSFHDSFSGGFDGYAWQYWVMTITSVIVASAFEIVYLYKIGLHGAFQIAHIAGLQLYPKDPTRNFLMASLARCALELGHPSYNVVGIDPIGQRGGLVLAVHGAVYKSKSMLTTFLLRLILKRFLTRSVSKAVLPFASAPLLMVWNAAVCYFVLQEAQLVALGPSAAVNLSDGLCDSCPFTVPYFVRKDILAAIGLIIRTTRAVHPSLEILLLHLQNRFHLHTTEIESLETEMHTLTRRLAGATYNTELRRLVALHVILAVVLTGRVRLYSGSLREVLEACEYRPGLRRIRRLAQTFKRGVGISTEQLQYCLEGGGSPPSSDDRDTVWKKVRRLVLMVVRT
eukprot:PhM_4_TR11003/c0_g1_i1/m.45993